MVTNDLDCPPDGPRSRGQPNATFVSLEVTDDCCLQCDYCFVKKEQPKRADIETARAAVRWAMWASGDAPSLHVGFFGGEPLLEVDLLRDIIPYAREQAAEAGKRLSFGTTTNMVLVTDEILGFCKRHGLRLNNSVDGAPFSQDLHRRFPDGSGSSRIVEQKARRTLEKFPDSNVRCTVTPETADHFYENVLYLVDLGYRSLACVPAPECRWTENELRELEQQLARVTDWYVDQFLEARPVRLKYLDRAIRSVVNPQRGIRPCGAAGTYLCTDTRGTVWPCHRWAKDDGEHEEWKLGTVFDRELKEDVCAKFLSFDCRTQVKADCASCMAVNYCRGGCPALNFELHGDMAIPPESHCAIARMMYAQGQRAHYLLRSRNNQAFVDKFYPGRSAGTPAPVLSRSRRRVPTCALG